MRKNRLTRFLMTSIVCASIALNYSLVFATNSYWSAQPISDFLSNKIEAPDVLNYEKYRLDITRQEFAQLMVGLYLKVNNVDKQSIQLKENPFTDTTNIDVQRAYSLGIIQGTSKNTFEPENKITREQMATILTRFLNIENIKTNSTNNLNSFIDKDDISNWAVASLAYCVDHQILQGSQNQIQPKEPTTVEQAITMLDRIAIEKNWITQSNDIYVRGFLMPNDTKIHITPDGTYDFILKINWTEICDTKKIENDLNYMLTGKFKESNGKINEIINSIIKTKQGKIRCTSITIEGYKIVVCGNEESARIKFSDEASFGEIPPIL